MSIMRVTMVVIALAFLLGLSRTVHAVPAAPVIHDLEQPDGTKLKARQWGDEHRHGLETIEGYAIDFDQDSKYWKYTARDKAGRKIFMQERPGIDLPPLGIPEHMERTAGTAQADMASAAPQAAEEPPLRVVPSTGTGKVLVILVNFSDTTTTFTTDNFTSLLFDNDTSSMKDYYEEVSYGAFSVSPGPGGIAGWYTAPNTHDYYGANTSDGYDAWTGTLVRDAVKAADAAGFNFAPYDSDSDGYVDLVAIVHQGTGEEAPPYNSTDIWSHAWSLNNAYSWTPSHSDGGEYMTNDGVKVDRYAMMPEKFDTGMSTVGVFAHEFGHALGLPDLYDTDYSSEGVGDWSLMAGGSWNYVTTAGDRPAHLDAWCKYKLGWIAPTLVSTELVHEPIDQAATSADVYQLMSGSPATGGEYFLVENRQMTGFDAGLPGAGLLIWHIDESVIDNFNRPTNQYECYPPGSLFCVNTHYHVALMQADNQWYLEKGTNTGDAGDPYPGTSSNFSFTAVSLPASKLWSRLANDVRITGISTSGPTMTATMSDSTPVTTTTAATTTIYLAPLSTTTTVPRLCPLLRTMSDRPRELGLLRLFRDTVMTKTALGHQYVELYYAHGGEIAGILEADRMLERRVVQTVLRALPVVTQLVRGDRNVVLQPRLLRSVESIALLLKARAGPQLQVDIDTVLAALQDNGMLKQLGLKKK